MRLAFVCAGWPPDTGGVETHAAGLARELAARGHELEVLCLDTHGALAEFAVRDEPAGFARVRRMGCRWRGLERIEDLVRRPQAEAVVARWLDERVPELVHVHHLTGFGTGVLQAPAARGLPVVLTLHDAWLVCPRGQRLDARGSWCARIEFERCGPCQRATWPALGRDGDAVGAAQRRSALARADLELVEHFVAPSQAVRREFEALGWSPERLCVIENGVDAAGIAAAVERARAARPAGAGDGRVHLGVLGTVQPSKGQLELARALLAAGVPGLVLDVHGALADYHGDASYAEALAELAQLDPRLRLHGAFAPSALPEVLAGLDALAVPSRWDEPYGLVAREGRAAGLFVLASARGGLRELAPRHVRFVASDDGAAWVAALREVFAGGAPPRVHAPHELRSVAALADDVERLYASTLARRGVRVASAVHSSTSGAAH